MELDNGRWENHGFSPLPLTLHVVNSTSMSAPQGRVRRHETHLGRLVEEATGQAKRIQHTKTQVIVGSSADRGSLKRIAICKDLLETIMGI